MQPCSGRSGASRRSAWTPGVGGKARAVYVTSGEDWSFTITYTDVVPGHSLRWITHFSAFPTKETRVTALFREADKGTDLLVRMENFETTEERDANKEAWRAALATLGDILREQVEQGV